MTRFVVSITSLPSRVRYIRKVIKSILRLDIDALYVFVPYCQNGVPQMFEGGILQHFPKDKRLKVHRCKDLGPITKILGILPHEKDPETLILTLDDDVIVKKDIAEVFKRKAEKYPHCVLSMSGWSYGYFPFLYQLVLDNKRDICVDWVQGVHGILYRRGFLNKKEVLQFRKKSKKKNIRKLLYRNDDHCISAYLETKGIKRISLGCNPVDYFCDYCPSAGIDAISGTSLRSSIKFWLGVDTISTHFKKNGLYYRNYTVKRSVLSFVVVFILAFVTFLLIGYSLGILQKGDWRFAIVAFLGALLVLYSIKDTFDDCFLDKVRE